MSGNNQKPNEKPKTDDAGHADAHASEDKVFDAAHARSGRVKFDERGNAIWEWSMDTGAFGATAGERLKRLDNPTLSIADDGVTPVGGVVANPLGTKKGYDPYQSGKLAKAAARKKTDLRKLSEWMKLKKQASSKKDDDE